ncbi:MAG: transglutaminase domain-containing protein [Spirochaetota bacterium]
MSDSPNRLALVPVLLVAGALVALTVLVIVVARDPVVERVSPLVAVAGEEVTVTGRHFGETVGSVVVAGRDVPASEVTAWSDEEISFVVPRRADSGLLYVKTDRGRSDGALLQIQTRIPRASSSGGGPGAPVIAEVDRTEVQVGALLTIRGSNFGTMRHTSRVVFSTAGGDAGAACASDIAYALWDDTIITVRVPAEAVSGLLSVVTPWGESNPVRVAVERPAGEVVADEPAEIGVRYGAGIAEVVTIDQGGGEDLGGRRDIVLRLPRVSASASQRNVRYLEDEADEFRFERVNDGFEREVIRTLLVDRYELRSRIDPARVSAAYESETRFFEYYTRSLPDAPTRDERVQEIAAQLRSGRASPYRIAEAAYLATLDSLMYALGRDDRSVLAGLESGYGDDFTYATLFVTLTRAAGVPSRPVGGVLVTSDGHAYPHFWAEFFVTGIGWIPVDPALGDGAFPSGFPVPDDPRAFYFGNLDNRRVAFGHGYDAFEPTFLDGIRVEPDDPYTLQRTYAVGGALVDAFRLTWFRPQVIGLQTSN